MPQRLLRPGRPGPRARVLAYAPWLWLLDADTVRPLDHQPVLLRTFLGVYGFEDEDRRGFGGRIVARVEAERDMHDRAGRVTRCLRRPGRRLRARGPARLGLVARAARSRGGSRTSAVAITSSSPAPGDGRPALAQRGVGGGEFPGPPGHRHAGRCTQVRRLASVTEPRRGRTGPLGRRRAASRRSSGPVRSRPAARPGPGRRRACPRSAPAPTGKGTGRPHFRCLAWRGRGRVPRVKAQARPRHWRTAQTVIVVCRAAGLMIAMRRPATG